MKRLFAPAIALAGLALGACGSSDDGTSGVQSEAAQQTIDAAKDAGFDLDESCVNDIASQLSDDDAQAVVDAGPSGDPDVSAEGSALASQLASCLSQEDLLDEFIAGMQADGQTFDEACVRENMEDFDLGALAAQGDNAAPTDAMVAALFECFDN